MNSLVFIYNFSNIEFEKKILEANNSHLKLIMDKFKKEIVVKDGCVYSSEEDEKLKNLFECLDALYSHNIDLTDADFSSILNNIDYYSAFDIVDLFLNKQIIFTSPLGKTIYPRSLNQKLYIKSLDSNDIVFALGPAGTGKTYLAVLYALSKLKSNKYKKIILVRPIVEAGEKLGFLPGDFKDKVDPYLVPIYDGLYDALGKENTDKMIAKGTIEVAPLAYMRGRTLENAIIILDEAQNTTLSQMKMFLTRLGFNSKMIITGDVTQIDLPNKNISGLLEAVSLLDEIDGIRIVNFQKYDVMRHPLVFKIIERYENKQW